MACEKTRRLIIKKKDEFQRSIDKKIRAAHACNKREASKLSKLPQRIVYADERMREDRRNNKKDSETRYDSGLRNIRTKFRAAEVDARSKDSENKNEEDLPQSAQQSSI